MRVHDPAVPRTAGRPRGRRAQRRSARGRGTERRALVVATEWPDYRKVDLDRAGGAMAVAGSCSTPTAFWARRSAHDPRFRLVAVGQPHVMSRLARRTQSPLITGANQGLGLRSPAPTSQAGASVLLCARDEALLERRARRAGGAGAARPARAGRCAPTSRTRPTSRHWWPRPSRMSRQVHVLVNNAGVYGPMGPIEEVDWDGVGPRDRDQPLRLGAAVPRAAAALQAAAVRQDRPALRRRRDQPAAAASAPTPRRRRPSCGSPRRSRSRCRPYGIDVNAIAPGRAEHADARRGARGGPDAVGADFYERMVQTEEQGGTPLERGAALAVFLGSAASDGITGRLLSAVWDPWEDLPAHRDDLDAHRHLHAAPDRAGGSRHDVGGP